MDETTKPAGVVSDALDAVDEIDNDEPFDFDAWECGREPSKLFGEGFANPPTPVDQVRPPAPATRATPGHAHAVRVFNMDDLDAYAARYATEIKDQDERHVAKQLIAHLYRTGPYRTLRRLSEDWRQRLDALGADFPNFSGYLDYLRTTFALAERECTAARIDPVLLAGPPGIGKSLVAQRIADLLDTGCFSVHFENAQENSALGGSSRYWSNAKPGLPFTAIIHGEFANPVFIHDELDKVSVDRNDPYGPLHMLLESTTASQVRDACQDWLAIDLSHLTHIATCNDVSRVPAPILSRLRVFDIASPTPAQAMAIVQQLWQRVCCEHPVATSSIGIAEDALHMLAHHPPRVAQRALREALGRAVYLNRPTISIAEVRASFPAAPAMKCGFV